MKKRTTFGITMMAAAVICVTGLVFAQSPMHGSTTSPDSGMPPEYQFTQDQIEEMEKIRRKYADKFLKVEKELAAKQVELESTWSQPDIASSTVYDIQRQVSDLEHRAEGLRIAANAEAAKILNPNQRTYFGANFEVMGSHGWSCPWDGAVGSFGWNCPWDNARWGAGCRGWNGRSGARAAAGAWSRGCGPCW
jgi:Spy/CpxP family protein refolding chaperone